MANHTDPVCGMELDEKDAASVCHLIESVAEIENTS